MSHAFFATVPPGLEPLLIDELKALGLPSARAGRGGADFDGPLEAAFRVCLWSRLASRVLLPLGRFPAGSIEALQSAIGEIPWEEHVEADGSLTIDFQGTSAVFRHTRFGAQIIKDAIVDRFAARTGRRPSVRFEDPDLRLSARLHGRHLFLGVDLSGTPLHRRGYRIQPTQASMKENLAAALVLLSGWRDRQAREGYFIDPMCGAGTLALEAAQISLDIAPGLERTTFGFSHWLGRGDPAVWDALRDEAHERRRRGIQNRRPRWMGCDLDPAAVRAAEKNAEMLGLSGRVVFQVQDAFGLKPPESSGVMTINPPYGKRLPQGREAQGRGSQGGGENPANDLGGLNALYRRLGGVIRGPFRSWRVGLFSAHPDPESLLDLAPKERRPLNNGPLKGAFLLFEPGRRPAVPPSPLPIGAEEGRTPGARMFANRLLKNHKRLSRWLRREEVFCFRLYDADMPEYAVAVDVFDGYAHIQEHRPPASVDPAMANQRLREVRAVVPEVLGLSPDRVFLKQRRRRKGGEGHDQIPGHGEKIPVREGPFRFLVNFTDHLDTGLFPDHRLTRRMIGEMAARGRFLNLFGYTGSATVYAAAAGAETVTVDLSKVYLAWARENLALNGLDDGRAQFIQADCLAWLEEEGRSQQLFDLIFLDPPTFSNSKRMSAPMDLQRQHAALIEKAMGLATPDGTLIFSCNFSRFKLDGLALSRQFDIKEITAATLPPDFQRGAPIHRCWRIRKSARG